MRYFAAVFSSLLLALLFTACGPTVVSGNSPCSTDDDCVPASCCHASSCVALADAPECGGIGCTEECQSDTLDCGGSCICQDGKCAAILNNDG